MFKPVKLYEDSVRRVWIGMPHTSSGHANHHSVKDKWQYDLIVKTKAETYKWPFGLDPKVTELPVTSPMLSKPEQESSTTREWWDRPTNPINLVCPLTRSMLSTTKKMAADRHGDYLDMIRSAPSGFESNLQPPDHGWDKYNQMHTPLPIQFIDLGR